MAKNVTILMVSSAAAADDVAQIDVPDDGIIVGCWCQITGMTMDAEADHVGMMVSFGSTSVFDTNDARTVIGMAHVGGSGAGVLTNVPSVQSVMVPYPDGMEVFAGERIHMHTQKNGGADIQDARALLVFKFKKFTARRR